jgi:hypothetical protein
VSGVSCSRAAKVSIALLLVLTLGWKWAVNSYGLTSLGDEPEEMVAERKVSEFLARNHFKVVGSKEVVFGMRLIVVTAPLCQMHIALTSSRGWHRDLIRNLTARADRSFVVFAGRIYSEQPIWLTVTDFLWSRFLRGVGINVQSIPIITVMAGPNCNAEGLPWAEVGSFDQR